MPEELVEPRFVERRHAAPDGGDLRRIRIHARDVMSLLAEPDGRHEPDIPCAYD